MNNKSAAQIIKRLEYVTASGNNPSNIFGDWLAMTEAALEALPRHVEAAKTGQPLIDTPETAALFQRLHSRYTAPYWDHFAGAFTALAESADEWQDTIGDVYMQWGMPNKWAGQFFTPWNIAKCMAQITMTDTLPQLHSRIKTAIGQSVEAQALLLAGLCIQDPAEAEQWFYNRVLPAAAPLVDPLTVCDPCCGSGVMLLAAASECPRWALDWGLVRFYGMDIDQTCVSMARVNCMLYGLNGYHLKCALALNQAELLAIPEPYQSAYTEAQAAEPERVAEIAAELRAGAYQQAGLFSVEDQPVAKKNGKAARPEKVKQAEPAALELF